MLAKAFDSNQSEEDHRREISEGMGFDEFTEADLFTDVIADPTILSTPPFDLTPNTTTIFSSRLATSAETARFVGLLDEVYSRSLVRGLQMGRVGYGSHQQIRGEEQDRFRSEVNPQGLVMRTSTDFANEDYRQVL